MRASVKTFLALTAIIVTAILLFFALMATVFHSGLWGDF